MKFKAILMALLVLAALAAFTGCKEEAMLENYTSDTFELGEDDPLSFDDLF